VTIVTTVYINIHLHTFHVCRWVETTNQNVCFGLCDSCQNSKRVPLHSALGWGPGVRPFALVDDLLMKTRRGIPLLFCNHSGHVHISKPVPLFCLHSGFSLQPCFQRPHGSIHELGVHSFGVLNMTLEEPVGKRCQLAAMVYWAYLVPNCYKMAVSN
jgi:hypothetical protein